MDSKKVVFLGSKPIGYECFAHLIEQSGQMGITVAGLLTRHRREFGGDYDLEALAMANNIPVFGQPDDMPECDIIYSVQYHKILTQAQIAKARQVAVNLHMAPLPEYRGSNQFSFALLDGKKEFGTTIHNIDQLIDHGDILFQKRFAIPDNCWVNELYQLTYEASVKLFQDTIATIVSGDYTTYPQSALEASHGTSLHFRSEAEAIKVIDLDWDREQIERHIRAASMPGFEPPYCVIDGRKVYFEAGGWCVD